MLKCHGSGFFVVRTLWGISLWKPAMQILVLSITDKKTCGPHEFQCKNNNCIQMLHGCDSQNDCSDNSDEENCSKYLGENVAKLDDLFNKQDSNFFSLVKIWIWTCLIHFYTYIHIWTRIFRLNWPESQMVELLKWLILGVIFLQLSSWYESIAGFNATLLSHAMKKPDAEVHRKSWMMWRHKTYHSLTDGIHFISVSNPNTTNSPMTSFSEISFILYRWWTPYSRCSENRIKQFSSSAFCIFM